MRLIQSQPAWRQLLQQQQRWKYSGCTCCGGGLPCVVGDCDAVPAYYTVTLGGLTGSDPSQDTICGCMNRSHRLVNGTLIVQNTMLPEPMVNSCQTVNLNWDGLCTGLCTRWRSTTNIGAVGCGSLFFLDIITDVVLTIRSGAPFSSTQATYSLPLASFDCLGSNTLPRISLGALLRCNGYPASVTIVPAI